MDQFRVTLVRISENLSDDQLSNLKFLCKGKIGKKKLEDIQSGTELFDCLMEKGEIGHDNAEFLSDILTHIGRTDLAEIITQFETHGTGTKDDLPEEAEQEKLRIAKEVIAQNLGKRWRQYGRKLGLSDAKLESIEEKHPRNLEEQVMELFREWMKLRKREAKVDELIKALRSCSQNYTADLVEKQLKIERP
ncbi:FAS-associated death domain protein [Chanos chanos]|uniref:FAS-associated death domain protein n=1 Tax=Chanos chanos TaxID=29144 RepID=A0A6J2USC4_CHACN|nr:FAS-associated death domain protein [Chanos chanos]